MLKDTEESVTSRMFTLTGRINGTLNPDKLHLHFDVLFCFLKTYFSLWFSVLSELLHYIQRNTKVHSLFLVSVD